MNCPGCGADNLEESKFCRNCGGRFASGSVDYSETGRTFDSPSRQISDLERWWMIGSAWGFYSVRALIGLLACAGLAFIGGVYCIYKVLQEADRLLLVPGALLFLGAIGAGYLALLLLRDIYGEPDDGIEVLTSEESVETTYELTNLPPRR
jgi:hypothetical protein